MSSAERAAKRLNWACGPHPAEGWVNCDISEAPAIDVTANVLEGLPFETGHFDYVVGIHSLSELEYADVEPALAELRRVLREGGVLRLALPDIDRALRAYVERDAGYFRIPDDEVRSLGGKLVAWLTGRGRPGSLYTFDFIEELLYKAGFRQVKRCAFKQTASEFPEIFELDNRGRENLFVEAVK